MRRDPVLGVQPENHHNSLATAEFERENLNMLENAPSVDWDSQLAKLNNYIEDRMFKQYVLPRLAKIKNVSDLRVLDIGAGKGRMTDFFLKQGFTCVAIEPSRSFFECLQKRFGMHPKVSIHCVDFVGYFNQFFETPFDLVYISGVTPYLDDAELDRFLKGIVEVLAPAGMILIRDIENLRGPSTKDGFLVRRAAKEMMARLRDHSFGIYLNGPLYPINVPWILCKRFPSLATRLLWDIVGCRCFWGIWWLLRKISFINRFRSDPVFVFYVAGLQTKV